MRVHVSCLFLNKSTTLWTNGRRQDRGNILFSCQCVSSVGVQHKQDNCNLPSTSAAVRQSRQKPGLRLQTAEENVAAPRDKTGEASLKTSPTRQTSAGAVPGAQHPRPQAAPAPGDSSPGHAPAVEHGQRHGQRFIGKTRPAARARQAFWGEHGTENNHPVLMKLKYKDELLTFSMDCFSWAPLTIPFPARTPT